MQAVCLSSHHNNCNIINSSVNLYFRYNCKLTNVQILHEYFFDITSLFGDNYDDDDDGDRIMMMIIIIVTVKVEDDNVRVKDAALRRTKWGI